LLSYHSSFDGFEFFREMDVDNNGYLTSTEFSTFFETDEDFKDINFVDIIQAWNGPDNNDRVTAADFARGLAPYTGVVYNPNPYAVPQRYPVQKYRKWNDEDQKQEQTDSWKYQLKLVLFLQGQIAKREFWVNKDELMMEPENIYLSLEEANTLWKELDQYKYGAINGNSLQRWLEFEAGFNLPPNDVHFIYEAFKSFEFENRITEKEWITALAGPQPEEEPQVVEEEGPKEAEAAPVNKNGSSLRKKKIAEPESVEQKNIR
jgi:Ca2+-binding EF-hand superfamily protein